MGGVFETLSSRARESTLPAGEEASAVDEFGHLVWWSEPLHMTLMHSFGSLVAWNAHDDALKARSSSGNHWVVRLSLRDRLVWFVVLDSNYFGDL